jgi:hypothetical protein
MNLPRRTVAALLALLVAVLGFSGATPASAMTRGTTTDGTAFLIGGIGSDEIAAMQAERPKYRLSVITATKPHGAHLADVHVRVMRADGAVIFDQKLEGPWLLLDLPPGRYEVEASFGAEQLRQTATLPPGGRPLQLVFRFGVEGDVLR